MAPDACVSVYNYNYIKTLKQLVLNEFLVQRATVQIHSGHRPTSKTSIVSGISWCQGRRGIIPSVTLAALLHVTVVLVHVFVVDPREDGTPLLLLAEA